MSHKRSTARFLLDTPTVVHHLHGHTLQQAAVREAVAGAEVLVPVFVRMEYLRGVILNLIEIVPNCRLCDFRKSQRLRLRRGEIDLTSPDVRSRLASNPGFVRQSEQAEEAANTKVRAPSCGWCERLGDTIIALQVERGVTVLTADLTFIPLGELLGRTVVLLPSLAEAKRRQKDP